MCPVSHVMCLVSHVTCNLSHVTYTNSHSYRPSPIIHNRLVHSRLVHSGLVPKSMKLKKRENCWRYADISNALFGQTSLVIGKRYRWTLRLVDWISLGPMPWKSYIHETLNLLIIGFFANTPKPKNHFKTQNPPGSGFSAMEQTHTHKTSGHYNLETGPAEWQIQWMLVHLFSQHAMNR